MSQQLRERVLELTRELTDDEFEELVVELYANRRGWTLSRSDLDELDRRSDAMARGEAIRVDDVDGFIDRLEPGTKE